MFEKSETIIRIDGRGKFCDIQEAFEIGKICFQFREYDETKAKGNRITKRIDCFLDLAKFSYFCQIMKSERIYSLIEYEKQKAGSNYARPYVVSFGGVNKPGKSVISRKLQVKTGAKSPLLLSAVQGPGKAGNKGQIQPAYLDKDAEEIMIPLSIEQCIMLGTEGERALRYYDAWSAAGTLEANLERLSKPSEKTTRSSQPNANHHSTPATYSAAQTPSQNRNVHNQQPAQMYYAGQPEAAQYNYEATAPEAIY